MDLDRRSDISGAGYSGCRGSEGGNDGPTYHLRLIKFYQRYNPEKIPRVHEFLAAYKGDEEELFRTLVAKYGPEPEPSMIGSVASGSNAGFNRQQGLPHVPKLVSREDGNCDRETPYYPAQRNIMESDLCNLLLTRQTSHSDLRAVYLGYLTTEHPSSAWNGMTYVTNVPVPIDENSRFLGHLWSGSLSNTKTIVHDKLSYTRTVFHCGESCSNNDFPHERWRLTLIRADHTPDTLYRVLWDPFLSPQAAAELLSKAPSAIEQDRSFFGAIFGRKKTTDSVSGSAKPSQVPPPPPPPPGAPRAGGFASHHSNNPQQQQAGGASSRPPPAYPPPMTVGTPMPLQPARVSSSHPASSGAAAAAAAAVSASAPQQPHSSHHHQQHHHAMPPGSAAVVAGGAVVITGGGPVVPAVIAPSATYHQPQQPHIVSAIDSLVQLVQGLEGRLTERISDLDKRLQSVENDVILLKEMSDQRQIEQLPEPWLEDGAGSNAKEKQRSSKGGAASGAGGTDEKSQAKLKRRQHRRRMEQSRERAGSFNDDDDGAETMRTATSLGTSIGARSSEYG